MDIRVVVHPTTPLARMEPGSSEDERPDAGTRCGDICTTLGQPRQSKGGMPLQRSRPMLDEREIAAFSGYIGLTAYS
jgi:hypothetical protein